MDETTLRRRGRIRLLAVTLGLVVVGVAGYLGFVWFVQGDRATSSSVLMVAALTGFAAFFSPCSFPLLLTFLARRADESTASAVKSALRVGLGATLLLGFLALVLAAGGSAIGGVLQFDQPLGRAFRVAVGGVLIVFGLRQSRVFPVPMGWLDSVARAAGGAFDSSKAATRAGHDVLYGFGYLLAGFG